jgi:hypothetical protein
MRQIVTVLAACCIFGCATGNAAKSSEEIPLSSEKALVYGTTAVPAAKEPIPLSLGPHLFLDDYLIASGSTIARVVQIPERNPAIPNPIVTGEEDGCFQPYMTILRNNQTGRFRLWYGSRNQDLSEVVSRIGYMESADGIHWERPHRILPDPGPIQFGCSVVDRGPASTDPSIRYTFAWWHGGGLRLAISPDGLTFTPVSEEPLIPHNHDITGLFFDTLRNRYVATISVYRDGKTWEGDRRIPMHSFSTDLLQWTQPHHVRVPDYSIDEGELHFYAMDGNVQRGELTIGMVKVLRNDLTADTPPDPPEAYGVGYTTLAWSRDGETWTRDPEPFFRPDPQQGAWDHAHAWIDEQLPVDDEVYLYYGGYARGHKVNRFEERQIGLVKMKRDRYVARTASNGKGELVTPLLQLTGKTLSVNVNAIGGMLRAEIRDATGTPPPGFGYDDCVPITTDTVSTPVTWLKSIDSLAGQTIQLAFALEHASLFAFYLE